MNFTQQASLCPFWLSLSAAKKPTSSILVVRVWIVGLRLVSTPQLPPEYPLQRVPHSLPPRRSAARPLVVRRGPDSEFIGYDTTPNLRIRIDGMRPRRRVVAAAHTPPVGMRLTEPELLPQEVPLAGDEREGVADRLLLSRRRIRDLK